MAFEADDILLDAFEIGRLGSGDAEHRDIIDEARRILEHGVGALLIGGGCGKPDEIEPGLESRKAQFLVFFRRQVDDDETIDAGRLGVFQETVDAINIDRIVIAHEDDGRRGITGTEFAHHRQGLDQRLACSQCPQSSLLDRRTVGHRIGEGHAEFDDVGDV